MRSTLRKAYYRGSYQTRIGALLNQFILNWWNNIKADGGTVQSVSEVNSYSNMAQANGMWDSIKFGMIGGYNLRTDGTDKYITKAYSLDLVPNNATQTTEASQPFLSGFIAPNEKWGIKNPTNDTRSLDIPGLTITGTITKVEATDETGKIELTHTDVVSQTITELIPEIYTGSYIVRNTTLSASQKTAEIDWFTSHNWLGYEGSGIPAVKIGDQVWQTSNCEMVATPQGNVIPEVTDDATWADSQNIYDTTYTATVGTDAEKEQAALEASAMWCYYNNDPSLGAIYGKLYNWFAVKLLQNDIDAYNLANPSTPWGWHVPSEAEFNTLTTALGGASVAGGKMKVAGTDYWSNPNTEADNSSGFTGLGSGLRYDNGNFYDSINGMGLFRPNSTSGHAYALSTSNESLLYATYITKQRGCSIRFIKD